MATSARQGGAPHHTEPPLSSFDRLPELLTEQVDRVRDRTAEAVSSDGASILRETSKLRAAFDELGDELRDRVGDLEATVDDLADRFDDDSRGNATTWPRRLFWLAVGTGIGVGVGYLTDPDRGQDRRAQLVDTAQTRADEVAREASQRATDVRDQVTSSAQHVAAETQAAAASVTDEVKDAAEDVAGQAQTSAERLADEARPS